MVATNDRIRNVRLNLSDASDSSLEVVFGPHHRLRIEEEGDDVFIELVATHHGIRVPANDDPLPTTLEEIINTARENHPEYTID